MAGLGTGLDGRAVVAGVAVAEQGDGAGRPVGRCAERAQLGGVADRIARRVGGEQRVVGAGRDAVLERWVRAPVLGVARGGAVAARRGRRGRDHRCEERCDQRSAHTYSADLITAIRAPDEIGSPSLIASFSMTPALWAVISFSIFIASMMVMIWPSSTVSPSLAGTFQTLPCSGETRSSPPPPPEPPLRSPRLGAARPAGAPPFVGAAPPPTGGGPMTLTSKRLPLTSTV